MLQTPHRSQPRAPRRLQDLGAGPIGAKKLAQHGPPAAFPRKSSPSTAHPAAFPRKNSPSKPKNTKIGVFSARRANFFALAPTSSRAGRTISRTRRNNMATLKPASPLRPKNAPKTAFSYPQRRRRFQSRLGRHPQRQRRFQTTAHLSDRVWLRCPWAVAGPGRATSGRPTLQTSSNQGNSNRLMRTLVTNVVNPSPKTSIFSEKALRLTTFVTTDQKCAQKTPRIDDVCNNTHQSTPKTQHARPRDAHRERRGLAGLRDEAQAHASTPGLTGVESAGGTGGHGRASRRGAERSEAA